MSLTPGTRIGSYEVLSSLGAGGMGEVYRAKDSKLKREIALKVLPADVANDRERMARFQREAEVLASLNHPNIAQIYGFEEGPAEAGHHIGTGVASGFSRTIALVMELVEGEDLAERLKRGAIPIDEALPIAKQIAEALEAAHEQGIIHRDLKPANIKVRPDGTVKVLDFGLAKAMGAAEPEGSALQATITSPAMTMRGMILGTAAYMAPEQARGKAVDKRADIWAFGCVLYEMLAGRRPFDGEEISDVLAAVLRQDIDWQPLPPSTPPAITHLLARCLERDLKRRLRDIGEARIVLNDPAALAPSLPVSSPAGMPAARAAWLPWTVAALFLVAAIALSVPYLRSPAAPAVVTMHVAIPGGAIFNERSQVAISPDGAHLVLAANTEAGARQLFLHSFETGETRPVEGTAGAVAPFWSPDSRSIGFFVTSSLKRVEISGGPARTIATAVQSGAGTWNATGTIVFTSIRPTGLLRVSAEGGTPTPVTTADESRGELAHTAPHFLPDDVHFLYSVVSEKPEVSGTYVGSLESSSTTRVLAAGAAAQFAPPGQLVFVRDEALFAQSFDPRALRVEGEAVRIAPSVARSPNPLSGRAGFSVSDHHVLVVVPENTAITEGLDLAWYDRTGKLLSPVGQANYRGFELSPDGKSLAAHRHSFNPDGGDIWITDLERATDRRFTFDLAEDASSPIWSPDGTMVAFGAQRGGQWGVYQKPANGAGGDELLFQSESPKIPMTWAPDGQSLVFVNYDPTTGADLWILPLSGNRKPTVYLQSAGGEALPEISPDGRWIAYSAAGTWVQSFPTPGTKYQVSPGGQARWRADGNELFVLSGLGDQTAIVALTVESSGGALKFGPARPLGLSGFANLPHSLGMNHFVFDVSADGQRFLLARVPARAGAAGGLSPVKVVLNWTSLLQGQ
jgi:Tol biopolymer transport system component